MKFETLFWFLILFCWFDLGFNYTVYRFKDVYPAKDASLTGSSSFKCSTNLQETACNIWDPAGEAIVALRLQLQFLQSPYYFKKAVVDFLCEYDVFCRVSFQVQLLGILLETFVKLSNYDPEPRFQLDYFSQLYHIRTVTRTKNISSYKDSDVYLLDEFVNTPDLSVSLILSLDLCDPQRKDFDETDRRRSFERSAATFSAEVEELRNVVNLRFLVGIEYCSLDTNFNRSELDYYTTQVKEIFGGKINSYYLERDLSSWLANSGNETMVGFRELLLRYAYENFHDDLYFFLDETNFSPSTYWLIGNINHLQSQGFGPDFGITVRGNEHYLHPTLLPWKAPKQPNENLLHLNSLMQLPRSIFPVLQKSHFDIFQSIDLPFFLPQLPTIMNDLLLMDVYSVLSSASHFNTRNKNIEMRKINLFDATIVNSIDDYLDQLHLLRRHLLEYYNTHEYENSPIIYFSQDLGFHVGDHFYEIFCELMSGCLSSSKDEINFEKSILETIKRETRVPQAVNFPNLQKKKYIPQSRKENDVYIVENISSYQFFGSTCRLNEMIFNPTYKNSLHSQSFYSRKSYKSIYTHPYYINSEQLKANESKFLPRNYQKSKVAVVTANFGGYEKECKMFAKQTIGTDFYCFTDNPSVLARGWMVDTVPYYLLELYPEFLSGSLEELNSFHHNQHPFNIAKYFKQQFYKIPLLQKQDYDIIIWIDGSVHINNQNTTKIISDLYEKHENDMMFVYEHGRNGSLLSEAAVASTLGKYTENTFNGIVQPMQRPLEQYYDYELDGYSDDYWQRVKVQRGWEDRDEYGVFLTCFLSFHMKRVHSPTNLTGIDFLREWANQNRRYSTQDQVSFPYVSQKLDIPPYPFPSIKDGAYGSYLANNLFLKAPHDGNF
jgi:hypothetical protein